MERVHWILLTLNRELVSADIGYKIFYAQFLEAIKCNWERALFEDKAHNLLCSGWLVGSMQKKVTITDEKVWGREWE